MTKNYKCNEIPDEILEAWMQGLCHGDTITGEDASAWLTHMSPLLEYCESNKPNGKILLNLFFEGILFYGRFFGSPKEFTILNFGINCNDTFAYACADMEPLSSEDEIPLLGELYDAFGWAGATALAACKRNCKPLKPLQVPEYFKALDFLETKGYNKPQ